MINSNKYENLCTSNKSAVSVRDGLTFLLVGGGIGAALALLFAPKSGREMRHGIADVSRRGYEITVEKATALKAQSAETLQTVKDKAGAAYNFAATRLNSGGEALAEAVSTTSDAITKGVDEIQEKSNHRSKNSSAGRSPASIF